MVKIRRTQEAQVLVVSAPTWKARKGTQASGFSKDRGNEWWMQAPWIFAVPTQRKLISSLLSLSLCQEVCLFLLNLCFLLFKLFIKRTSLAWKAGRRGDRQKTEEDEKNVLTSSKVIVQTTLSMYPYSVRAGIWIIWTDQGRQEQAKKERSYWLKTLLQPFPVKNMV